MLGTLPSTTELCSPKQTDGSDDGVRQTLHEEEEEEEEEVGRYSRLRCS